MINLDNESNSYDNYLSMMIKEYEGQHNLKLSDNEKSELSYSVEYNNVFENCNYNGGYSKLCDEMLLQEINRVVKSSRNK